MITILVGKSASGKDTMMRQMLQNGMKPIVSYTTRPMREGEKNGVDYHFVSPEEFISLVKQKFFMEYRSYKTKVNGYEDYWFYGSPLVNPDDGEYVAVLELQGTMKYIEKYGSDKCNILLLIADDKVRETRAKKRGSFDQTEWDRRLVADQKDFSEEKIAELERFYGKPIKVIDNN